MKMPKLTEEQSIFALGLKAGLGGQSVAPSRAEPPKEITIRVAENGGYIVSAFDNDYNRKEMVYEDMDGLVGCIESKLGKPKKKAD